MILKIFFEFCREINTKLESVLQGKKLYQVKSTTHHKKFVMNTLEKQKGRRV